MAAEVEPPSQILQAKLEDLRGQLVSFVLREIKAGRVETLPEQVSKPLLDTVVQGVRQSVDSELGRLADSHHDAIVDAAEQSAKSAKAYAALTAEVAELTSAMAEAAKMRQARLNPKALQSIEQALKVISDKLEELDARPLAASGGENGPKATGSTFVAASALSSAGGWLNRGLLGRVLGIGLTIWAIIVLLGAGAAMMAVLQLRQGAQSPAVLVVRADAVKQAAKGASAAAEELSHLPAKPKPAGAGGADADARVLQQAGDASRTLDDALAAASDAIAQAHDPGLARTAGQLQGSRQTLRNLEGLIDLAQGGDAAGGTAPATSAAEIATALTREAAHATQAASDLDKAAVARLSAGGAQP